MISMMHSSSQIKMYFAGGGSTCCVKDIIIWDENIVVDKYPRNKWKVFNKSFKKGGNNE